MKLKWLGLKGIGTHRDIKINTDQLGDAKMVAVIGDNGAGKTTALESVPGILYRKMPSRGGIVGMATDGDSEASAAFEVDGNTIECRLKINGTARRPTSESFIWVDGQPLSDGRAKDYQTAIAKHFPDQQVFLASAFAAQGASGFIGLKPAQRKELFAELLGLDGLFEIAARCAKHRDSVLCTVIGLEADMKAWQAQAERKERIEEALTNAVVLSQMVRDEYHELEAKQSELKDATDALLEKGAELDHAEQLCRANVKSGMVEVATLARQIESIESANTRRADAAKHLPVLEAKLEAMPPAPDLDSLRERLRERLRDAEQHNEALAEQRREWGLSVDRLRHQVTQRREGIANAEAQAEALCNVPCDSVNHSDAFDTCPLIAQARAARRCIPGLQSALEAAEQEHHELTQNPPSSPLDLSEIRASADRAADAVTQRRSIEATIARLRVHTSEIEASQGALSDLQRRWVAASKKLGAAKIEHGLIEIEQEQIAEELKLRGTYDATSLSVLASRLSDTEKVVTELTIELGAAKRAESKAGEIQGELTTASAELDDWKHLTDAFRTGIPALEIDAAGPAVSSIANDLLHQCYGNRFSVELVTSQLKADGKGHKETFTLSVIDTEKGWEGDASMLSGGERVLVGEAFALAIAIYNARRSDIPMLDLYRDECAGALSEGNARRYIDMLRKAVELGGFHRCYYVSHVPELWGLADARLVFADGICKAEV